MFSWRFQVNELLENSSISNLLGDIDAFSLLELFSFALDVHLSIVIQCTY